MCNEVDYSPQKAWYSKSVNLQGTTLPLVVTINDVIVELLNSLR